MVVIDGTSTAGMHLNRAPHLRTRPWAAAAAQARSDAIAAAIVASVAMAATAAAAASEGDPIRGRLLYDETPGGASCASCHGAADFGLLRLPLAIDPQVTRAAIVAGKGGMNLPNLLALSDADLTDIAAYVANPAAGRSVPPAPAIDPTTLLDFGLVGLAGAPSRRSVEIRNRAAVPLSIGPVTVAGGSFSLETTCPGWLAPGGRCHITLAFTPTSSGPQAGELRGTLGQGLGPWQVPLAGRGAAQPVSVLAWREPAALEMETRLPVGRARTLATMHLDNTGSVAAVGTEVSLVGEAAGDYALTGPCATPGSVIPPGTSCTLQLTLMPSVVGSRPARLQVRSSGTDPDDLRLQAVGVLEGATPEPGGAPPAIGPLTNVGAGSLAGPGLSGWGCGLGSTLALALAARALGRRPTRHDRIQLPCARGTRDDGPGTIIGE